MSTLTTKTKALGKSLGFDIVGITTADRFARDERAALERVNDGLMDGLPWYTAERVRKANSPRKLLEDARSVVSLAMSYNYGEAESHGTRPAREDSAVRLGRRLPRRHEEASPIVCCRPTRH